MPDVRATIHTIIKNLVTSRFPKNECAAREIADHWNVPGTPACSVDYGGFSRKMKGSREWTASDIIALQRMTGTTRITEVMQNASGSNPSSNGAPASAIIHAQALIKEGGEGANALLSLTDGGDIRSAMAEVQDLIEASQAAYADLERLLEAME